MKTVAQLITYCFISFFSIAQSDVDTLSEKKSDLPLNKDGMIEYAGVVNVDSASAETLYSRAKIAVAKMYVIANSSMQMGDDVSKTIIRNTLIHLTGKALGITMSYGEVSFVLSIQCKDGKYRYIINQLVHSNSDNRNNFNGGPLEREKPLCGTFNMTKSQWKKIKLESDEKIKSLIVDINKYMTGKAINSSDNW